MQQRKAVELIALFMVLVSLWITHGVARVPAAPTRYLPVERFPRLLGDWAAGPDMPVDPVVRKMLTTATIVSRNYSEPEGRSVELMLLTAARRQDFHDPNECFPGSGWTLGDRGKVVVEGQPINTIVATRDTVQMDVWYCWMSALDFERLDSSQRRLQRFRRAIFTTMGRKDDVSLFVRLMAPHQPGGNPVLNRFCSAALPSIRNLWQPGSTRVASEPTIAPGGQRAQ